MNKSIIEIPLWPLFHVKRVREYYKSTYRHCDLYEHVYGGFFLCILFLSLSKIWQPFFVGVPLSFVGHVFVKELVYDYMIKKKDKGKIHSVDLITRIYGFVLAMPFIILAG